ncbi:receptor-like protein kinase 5, partial [Triticum urartu]
MPLSTAFLNLSRWFAIISLRLSHAIINNLTDNNVTRMWPNRRAGEDERLYLVHNQGTAGINTRYPLIVKKFQNVNPTLRVDGNVRYRYKSEMIMLASNSHDNIIKVVDIIQREDAIMLVYEYPVNGSLQSWLHQPMDVGQQLRWLERRVITVGVGQGLCHLHHGCNKPIVHHNISSDNILLDRNFKAVIASFGDAQMTTVDAEGKLKNMFWCDSQSRRDYLDFDDVIVFDSTYKMNRYGMPFIPFIGLNNHRCNTVFGCAVVSDETEDTYVWVLHTFLRAHCQKKPRSVITDGDATMIRAVRKVLTDVWHRLCSWHIEKNMQKHLHHKSLKEF